MRGQLLSELLKTRTSRACRWLLLWTLLLVAGIVALHVVSLSAAGLTSESGQLKIFGMGTTFGTLFASLLGALSITGEIRHGTIRPTLLATPNRARVIAAKVAGSAIGGAGLGLVAEAVALGVGCAGLAWRGIDIAPGAWQLTQLLIGGAAAAALWGAIGVGVGALVRSQVGALVGLAVWVLFIEQTLIGIVPSAARYAPGPSAGSLAGAIMQETSTYLLAPSLGALVIAGYVVAATAAGMRATARRDVS